MYQPIRRWRAAVVGVVLGLASQAALVSAGVVAPPSSDSSSSEPVTVHPQRADNGLPAISLASTNDVQPFWYPGADGPGINDAVSISSIPVQADKVGPGLPGTQQHPLIPLPGAAWTGMAGLLGLGAVKLLRNARRLLA